ncbi:fatty-acid amide hydrolase 2-like isoform X2 [Venturia canescens]|nr:fatty-acid amide hydrolase 2-like isoform X2 [Venturia canescens]XP_043278397.1 fatty-acid amide hydrolase 2-like isoform X2 [Venturia canescens]
MDNLKQLLFKLLCCMVVQLHCIFDYVIDILFGIYYDGKEKKVPAVKNSLLLESGISLAEKIRNQEVSSEDVVKAFIERCKEVNGLLNAVVIDRYEEAIEEAKNVDKLLHSKPDLEILKKTKPFLGVPFTTKESNETEGLPHSMGMTCRKGHISTEDATVVRYLKSAGGILIAKTNIPEMNLWVESRNHVYGQTNNPYNTTRTVGGSSGGEGAILAACGAPISIGSDIGGSIRMPAFFNGVFGHKPSEGLSPLKGIGMRSVDFSSSMAEAGPMCKKGDDLIPLLKVLIGDNVSKIKLDTPVNLKNLNIFYQEGSGDLRASKVNNEMRLALTRAVEHFRELTGSAQKIRLPGSEYSFRLWRYWMTKEDADFKSDIMNRKSRTNAVAEIKKFLTNRSEITFAVLMKLMSDDFFPQEKEQWATNVTKAMKEFLLEKLGDNGVLFYPSAPFPASYHYSYFLRPFNFGYWCIFNVLRLPVCQVPLGLDSQGLPVGVQVVASPFNDHLCIAVARELEKTFGGWVPPS